MEVDHLAVVESCIGNFPRMLHDECLVRLEKPERLTAKMKLHIPDNAQRQDFELYQGIVLAAGPGRRYKSKHTPKAEAYEGKRPVMAWATEVVPNEVQPGDRVLFTWMAGQMQPVVRWTEEGEEMRVISEWQIQAKWPGDLSLDEAMR